jgi:hypothetical protein
MSKNWIVTVAAAVLAGASLMAQPPARGPRPGGRGPDGSGMLGPGARFIGAQPGMPGRTVKNAAYSADVITETTQALADGNRITRKISSKIYRDSEGRTRREQSLDSVNSLAAGSNLPQVIFISDPVAGTDFALNPADRTATSSRRPRPMTGANAEGRRGPDPRTVGGQSGTAGAGRAQARSRANDPNVKTEQLGRQLIEGVPADGTRTTLTIPAGQIGNEHAMQIITETWYSPELQTTVLSKRSDPRSGETVFRLANVSRAEPPRTLFDVPVDYKVSEASRGRGFGPRQ